MYSQKRLTNLLLKLTMGI